MFLKLIACIWLAAQMGFNVHNAELAKHDMANSCVPYTIVGGGTLTEVKCPYQDHIAHLEENGLYCDAACERREWMKTIEDSYRL